MGPRNVCLLAITLAAASLVVPQAAGQDTYSLTALPPTVNAVTHGAIGAPFFTETHSSTPGTLTLDVVTNNNTKGSGTVKVTAPSSLTGTLDNQANLLLNPSSQFTVNAAISNTNFTKITAFVSGGARSVEGVQGVSLPLTLGSITAPTDTNTVLFTVWVDFTLPLTPGSQFSYSYIRYEIVFKWKLESSCPAKATTAAKDGGSAPKAVSCDSDPDLGIDHIEVVQSVQTANRDVKLVQGREAFVRVFVRSYGKNAGELTGIHGEVLVEGKPLAAAVVPYDPPTVAPVGRPYTKTMANSLAFKLSPVQMLVNNLTVTARVWLQDETDKVIQETVTLNNETSITVPVTPNPTWPATYFIGLAPVCLEADPTGAEGGCPEKLRPESGLLDFLPVKRVQASPVYFPKITLPHFFDETPDTTYAAIVRLYLEYLKSLHLSAIFPVAAQPSADQIIFSVYGDLYARLDGDFGVPGGLANTWLVRSRTYYGNFSDYQLAHGIGHNLGLAHYNEGSRIERNDGTQFAGWSAGAIHGNEYMISVREVALRPEFKPIPENPILDSNSFVYRSIMDAVPHYTNNFVSPAEFNALFDKGPLAKTTSPPVAAAAFSGQVLVISGAIDASGATGTLDTGFRQTTTVAPVTSIPTGSTCLRFFPAGASSDYCFNVKSLSGTRKDYFAVAAPFPTGTQRVALMRAGRELASLSTGTPPTVTLISPAGGETWQGVQKVRWSATGSSPVFTVQYSPDDGTNWLPLSPSLTATEFDLKTNEIVGGEKVRFRVLASVGIDTGVATSAAVRVPQNQQIALDVTQIDFPNTRTGEFAEAQVQVKSTGDSPVWAVANPPDNAVFMLIGTSADILAPGETLTLTVRFAPTASGAQQGTLRIGDKTVTLRASAFASVTPSVQVTPKVDFGQVEVGKTKDTTFLIRNAGEAPLNVTAINATGTGFSAVAPKLGSLTPGASMEITLRLTNAGAGARTGQVTIASSDPTRPQVQVALTAQGVTGAIPAASAAGVLNAASFAGGAISPGEIVTVFGSNIGPAALTTLKLDAAGKVATSLGEARVLFDDIPGAMIYTLAGQNSVVVPYSIAGKTTTKMVMEYQGRRSDPITLNVAAAAPALFSANSSGTGPGAILNFAVAGSTVNTPQNPIDKGGIIILYGTGEGVVTPPNQDGDVVGALHTPVLGNAKVTIGGINANVLFTGSAPSLVAGVLQINVEVPLNAPAGNQPVVVTIGNFSSQAGLTVAIKGTATQAPAITVDQTTLDFGTVSVNQSKDLTLTIRNTGTATLTVSSTTSSNTRFGSAIGLAAPNVFGSFSVGANSSQTIAVRFTPTAAGGQNGILTLTTNDPSRPTVTINLTGTGATASAAPNISLDPTTLDFGAVAVGQSKDLTLAVRNIGTAALTITNISGTSPRFTPVGITVPITINAGSSQNLTFRFSPIASGVQTGSIVITSNDPARPTLTVNITGSGGSGAQTITFGQTINGTLTSAAGFASDCDVCFAESYQLTVATGRNIVITLNSTAFDTYLNVIDSNGTIVGSNDDVAAGNTNSRISGIISAGVYRIEVTTAIAGKTGAYTLAIAP